MTEESGHHATPAEKEGPSPDTAKLSEEEKRKQDFEEYKKKEALFIKGLEYLKPEMLVEHFKREHPQTIALIISTMNQSPQASRVLKLLPEKLQANVAYRILNMKPIPPGVLTEIIEVFFKEMDASGGWAMRYFGGKKSFNSILELADDKEGKEILENLTKHYPQSKTQLDEGD